jgi:hypothetical protein
MIDLSTNDVTKYQPRSVSRRDDEYVVVSTAQVAPTFFNLEEFLRNFHRIEHVATYIEKPIDSLKRGDLFRPAEVKSIYITAPLIVGGYFIQPPIDEGDFVYFDD